MPFGYHVPATVAAAAGGAGEVEITVTVSASKFVLDGVSQQDFTVLPGMIYKFDVSHTSNDGHVFALSLTDNNSGSSEYTVGRTRSGTAGTTDAYVTWDVPLDVADTVYYYCTQHGGMGGEVAKTGTGEVLGVMDLVVTTSGLEDDIAALAFKVAAANSLDDFNLSNQMIDDFKTQAESEIDISDSTNITTDSYDAGVTGSRWSGFVPAGDPDWDDVVLLITGAESVSGGSFTESSDSGHTINLNSATQTTSSGGKFEEGYTFNNNVVTLSQSSDFVFGTNDFTIEFWVKWTITNQPNYSRIFMTDSGGNGTHCLQIAVENDLLQLWHHVNGAYLDLKSTTNIVDDQDWHLISASRQSGVIYLHVDGTKENQVAYTQDLVSPNGARIAGLSTSDARYFTGVLDGIRVTKGVGRYGAADYVIPSASWPTEEGTQAYNNISLVSDPQGSSVIPTSADIVLLYDNTVGTAVLNTDLKAWASRDNGTTWTQGTLVGGDTIGDEILASSHDIDISGQPSGTSLRYKITTHNQASTKLTAIGGVSLGWTNPSDVTYSSVTAERGVSVISSKAALIAITPSTVVGQFYFVSATNAMYYSNGSVWTLLGSDAPGWGSFTEDYGRLDADNGSSGTITHTPTSSGAEGSGTPMATSSLAVTDEAEAIHVFSGGPNVTVSNCTHSSPSHTGAQSLANAGVTVNSSSGDITITSPLAWESDSVLLPVAATDGVNILTKNIIWSIRPDIVPDPHWDNVTFALQSNVDADSTTFSGTGLGDQSDTPHTITRVNDTYHETDGSRALFWDSSIKFDGTTDALIFRDNMSDFTFGANAWTIDFWFYRIALSGTSNISWLFDFRDPPSYGHTNENYYPSMYIDASNQVRHWQNGTTRITSSAVSLNNWHHVGLRKDGNGVHFLYINGGYQGSYTNAYPQAATPGIHIGNSESVTSSDNCFNGYINDFRITKGVSRYSGTGTADWGWDQDEIIEKIVLEGD